MRTRIVVFFTLLIGLTSLWIVLFGLSFLAAMYVPPSVPETWIGRSLGMGCTGPPCGVYGNVGVCWPALGQFGRRR
ncbi:MAG: hypothetical protein R2867_18810 [Caldilineaceae bacterium]